MEVIIGASSGKPYLRFEHNKYLALFDVATLFNTKFIRANIDGKGSKQLELTDLLNIPDHAFKETDVSKVVKEALKGLC